MPIPSKRATFGEWEFLDVRSKAVVILLILFVSEEECFQKTNKYLYVI